MASFNPATCQPVKVGSSRTTVSIRPPNSTSSWTVTSHLSSFVLVHSEGLLVSSFIAILIDTNHFYRQCCEYEERNSSVPTSP